MSYFGFIVVGIILFFANPTLAQDAHEIMQKAADVSYRQGQTFRTQVSMVILDKKGRERVRKMTMLRKNSVSGKNLQKYFVYFKKPVDVYKMVFMVWKNEKRSDDRWLYLPAADLVKRIAGSDGRTSFAGSHFVYEDVSGRGIDKDVHEIIEEDGHFFIVKSTPITSDDAAFNYKLSRIDKETYLPMKVQYIDEKGATYRTYSVLKTAIVDGFYTVTESQMEDNLNGSKTRLSFTAIKYNLNLPENIFTERFLRRPPLKLLL